MHIFYRVGICNCKSDCNNNKCHCKKAGGSCNSRCHSGRSCQNKWCGICYIWLTQVYADALMSSQLWCIMYFMHEINKLHSNVNP